jgi:hypothetical protein
MAVAKSLLYYSVNTYLSHYINTTFYNDQHYVWCSPVFDPTRLEASDPRRRIPKSSSPISIYKTYQDDVTSGDLHSDAIKRNRLGLKAGATHRLQQDVIDADEYQMINDIVDAALITDFAPLIYVIPEHLVASKIRRVSVSAQANPLSAEYVVDNLMKGEFELLVF